MDRQTGVQASIEAQGSTSRKSLSLLIKEGYTQRDRKKDKQRASGKETANFLFQR